MILKVIYICDTTIVKGWNHILTINLKVLEGKTRKGERTVQSVMLIHILLISNIHLNDMKLMIKCMGYYANFIS